MSERKAFFWVPFLAIVGIAAVLRIPAVINPGLWVDEMFSIAMATGHGLEHPAADAVARLEATDVAARLSGDDPATRRAFRRFFLGPAVESALPGWPTRFGYWRP